jgi:predicted acyltransferase
MPTLAQPAPATPGAADPGGDRLRSVDALRGFDMVWIVGAAPVVHALARATDAPLARSLSRQLTHVRWVGLHAYDLIFPLFLFLVGVSAVFSLRKALARAGRGRVVLRVLRRGLLLYLLGVVYYGGVSRPWPDVQLVGVLQRIAVCYVAAALLYCAVPARALPAVAAALLVGYWALVALVPFPDLRLDKSNLARLAAAVGSDSPAAIASAVPGRVRGVYEEGYNLTNYLDFRYLPGRKGEAPYNNEGLLSTIPSVAVCLGGLGAGLLLESRRLTGRGKVARLLAAGAAAVLLGYLWGLQFPLVKRIWSSSFVLVATGYSAMLLGAFYLVVDVWRWRRWCEPFVWVGTNAITVYLAVRVVSVPQLAERLVGGDVKSALDAHGARGLGDLAVAVVGLGLVLLLARFLHRHRLFLRL